MAEKAKQSSLSLLDIVRSYVPKSVAQPFADNMVLTVAALAILIGAAMRSLKATADGELSAAVATFERLVVATYQIVLKILSWIIELAPIAICLAVAGVVGATGPGVFRLVGSILRDGRCGAGNSCARLLPAISLADRR